MRKELENRKLLMHSAVAHHRLSHAQPLPQQWPRLPFPSVHTVSIGPCGLEHALGHLS